MLAEEVKRGKDLEASKRRKAERTARRAAAAKQDSTPTKAASQEALKSSGAPASSVAFVFPGQGSQAVGMLQVCTQQHAQPMHHVLNLKILLTLLAVTPENLCLCKCCGWT